jgi:hypothetical protein
MACKLPHKDAYSNTRQFLLENGVITNNLLIRDRRKFEELITQLEQNSLRAYGISGRTWENNRSIAQPNLDLLSRIDEFRKIQEKFDEQEAGKIVEEFFPEPGDWDSIYELSIFDQTFEEYTNHQEDRDDFIYRKEAPVPIPENYVAFGPRNTRYEIQRESLVVPEDTVTELLEEPLNKEDSKLYKDLVAFGLSEEEATVAYQKTKTQAFKNWFGNSKAVDANGEPLLLFHGTIFDIKAFSRGALGKYTGAPSAKKGFFFTNNIKVAQSYISEERVQNQNFIGEQNTKAIERYGKLDKKAVRKKIQELETLLAATNSFNVESDTPHYYEESEYLIHKTKPGDPSRYWSHGALELYNQLPLGTYIWEFDNIRIQYGYTPVETLDERRKIRIKFELDRFNTSLQASKFDYNSLIYYLNLLEEVQAIMERTDLPNLSLNTVWEAQQDSLYSYVTSKYGNVDKISFALPAPQIIPVFLSAQDPLLYDYEGSRNREVSYSDLITEAQQQGKDSTIFSSTFDSGFAKEDEFLADVYVVLDPNQVKSVNNRGSFSSETDLLLYQTQGESSQTITPELKEQLLNFLKAINPDFRVETLNNLGVNGLTRLNEFLIQLREGTPNALAEETAHVLVELLPEGHPLKKRMIEDVKLTRMYAKVVEEYSHLPAYQIDGKPNYPKLQREAAAKLVSLYLFDRDAFRHYTGSDSLYDRLVRTIKEFFRYLRGVGSPFSKAAQMILSGDATQLDLGLAVSNEVFYQLGGFETLNQDPRDFDRVLLNLNDTLLDLKSWKGDKKALFFDTARRAELDQYYTRVPLTKFGLELKDKMSQINPRRVTVVTQGVVTPALKLRLLNEFGITDVRRMGYDEEVEMEGEDGSIVIVREQGPTVEELIYGEAALIPNQRVLYVDNINGPLFNREERPGNLVPVRYANQGVKYVPMATRVKMQEEERKQKEFSENVLNEMQQINKSDLIRLADQSFRMIRNYLKKLEDEEKHEELSALFKDEYGDFGLPIDTARTLQRFLEELDTYEEGVMNFVKVLQANLYTIKKLNQGGYTKLRDLLTQGEEQTERAVKQTALLMRMILSWEEWADSFGATIPSTGMDTVAGLLNEFKGELSGAKREINKIAVQGLSQELSSQWRSYNDGKLALFRAGKLTQEQLDQVLLTPQKMADYLYGKEGDVNGFSMWVENAIRINDAVIPAITRMLEVALIRSDEDTMQEALAFTEKIRGIQTGLSDEEAGKQITYVDQENFREGEEIKQRDVKMFLSPFKNLWRYDVEREKVEQARKVYLASRESGEEDPALKQAYKDAQEAFKVWEAQNWYDETTEAFKNIYTDVPGLVDEVWEKALEKQNLIWEKIRQLQAELRQSVSEEAEEALNKKIQDLHRERKLLRNEYDVENNREKTGEDLEIARKLQKKSEIDRQIYEYKVNWSNFSRAFKEQIQGIADDGMRVSLLALLDESEGNLRQLYEFLQQEAVPHDILAWFERNTLVRYSKDFYEVRKELSEQIQELSARLESKLPEVGEISRETQEIWERLMRITTHLRDEDNIFDATLSNEQIQAEVQRAEEALEDLKVELREVKTEALEDDKKLKALFTELNTLYAQFSAIQSRNPTEYYNEQMHEKLLPYFDFLTPAMDYVQFINSGEFESWFDSEAPQEFKDWFYRNHFHKSYYSEEEFGYYNRWMPTYIWTRVEPIDEDFIEVVPNWKYSKRELKEMVDLELEVGGVMNKIPNLRLKTEKIDNLTWDPLTERWLPKSREFRNEAYFNLRTGNPKLFEYLEAHREFHIKTQMDKSRSLRIGMKVPFMHRRITEGNYMSNVWKQFSEKVNPFEQGEDNANPIKRKTLADRIRSFIGVTVAEEETKTVKTDYLGRPIQQVRTPYSIYLDPKDVTNNTALALIAYNQGAQRTQNMVESLPGLQLIEQVLEQFNPSDKQVRNQRGELVSGSKNNRLDLHRHLMDTRIYGQNKKFELGKGMDRFFMRLRNLNNISSLSLINMPNAIKNFFQGSIMSVINAQYMDWATEKSMSQALFNWKNSFMKYMAELETPTKSLDFHIMQFFNPGLSARINEMYLNGARNRLVQDKWGFFTQEAGEFGIGATLIHGHLMHKQVLLEGRKVPLYEALVMREGRLALKDGTADLEGQTLGRDFLYDTKLKFKNILEDTQGKKEHRTILETYTLGQAIMYFKSFFVPFMRSRFAPKRRDIVGGNDMEGYYMTAFKQMMRYGYNLFSPTKVEFELSEDERRNLRRMRNEFLAMLSTSLLIAYGFGFDDDDEDKYKKLKDNSWLTNTALLVAINTKREIDSTSLFPYVNLEENVVPPVFSETYNYVTNPFIGFSVISNGTKMLNALSNMVFAPDEAYYDRDMPQYFISEDQAKAEHYARKVVPIDQLLYNTNPEGKIQVIMGALARQ